MELYKNLSKIRFLQSYAAKFLFIAFLGIHVPLIACICWIVFGSSNTFSGGQIIFFVLIFTLLATGMTLYILYQLLAPIGLMRQTVDQFLRHRTMPELPLQYPDEVGTLMRETQFLLTHLIQEEEERTDLIATLSHDLRSPMSGVLGYAELLQEDAKDEITRTYGEKIEKVAQKQIDLSNSILRMLKAGGLSGLEKEIVPLSSLVDNAVSGQRDNAVQKNINLDNQIGNTPCLVYVNETAMTQALTNIIHNAIKFSPKDKKVTISEKGDVAEVVIMVKDEGIGLSKDIDPEGIFQKFTKYGREGTAGEKSTGFGLFMCRKVIEQHGGRIYATSEGEGQGTTVHIHLPRYS